MILLVYGAVNQLPGRFIAMEVRSQIVFDTTPFVRSVLLTVLLLFYRNEATRQI